MNLKNINMFWIMALVGAGIESESIKKLNDDIEKDTYKHLEKFDKELCVIYETLSKIITKAIELKFKTIASCSKKLELVSFEHLNSLRDSETITLEFYLKIVNIENPEKKYLRVIVHSQSNGNITIGYMIDNKNILEEYTMFYASENKSSLWSYNILEKIFRTEKIKHSDWIAVIQRINICSGFVQKNHKEGLLFVENDTKKLID